ncbi:glutamine--fructose-6-phosphate transaminase (isomerizing) [Candidatus Gottesmanbacteria bacterium]|nr:glutamine--fructose-6-phosphate transaminase (isomerizing) [Candidatus Gottesmanbacteria bacterium]
MCGIFGYVGQKKNAASIVLEGLKSLEYRGYDSWGVAVVPNKSDKSDQFTNPTNQRRKIDNKIIVKKKIGKIGDASVSDLPPATLAFGHTRWATHGGVTDANAHPHVDCTGTIALIHNGIFENYQEVKSRLHTKGHRFVSDTDTEVTVHLIEEYAKSMMFTKAVQRAFNDMEGLDAIIAIHLGDHQLVAVRNGSPLVIGFGDGENYLASDAAALLPYTRQVHFLEDDEMAIVTDDDVNIYHAGTGETIHPKKQHLNWTIDQVEKGTFKDFMLKEIYEQPGLLSDIATTSLAQSQKLVSSIQKAKDVYMVGCGSASYVCLAGSYLFSKIAKRHINWAVGSEFGYQLEFLRKESLVFALSQSGETMDTLESVKKAREKGTKIFALVNVLGSSLYRLSDYKMLVGVGPEKAVASTKALTGMLAHIILLAYTICGKPKEGQMIVEKAAEANQALFSKKSIARIKKLAKTFSKKDHMYVIGRGLSYPASLETALKIKEISYIHAEGMAAGELKHGPLALVEKGIPCIAFLPDDETYGANLAGAMEMKARGGTIIGVSSKSHEIFDYYVPVKDAKEATIIPNIIFGQLFAYYLTLERGFDPDKPRNLAKSVTVK